ncbi:MAG TPA: hypothetical protein VHV78_16915, partial [Gemmatimonadaceae bacterium]|nr:hypothetical protein [Gemmatimonadaceae bacterium]
MKRRTIALAVAIAACTSSTPAPVPVVRPIPVTSAPRGESPPAPRPTSPPSAGAGAPTRLSARTVRDVGDTTIRVLISANTVAARIASPSGLVLTDRDGGLVARAGSEETW